jgi:hypothetical protein
MRAEALAGDARCAPTQGKNGLVPAFTNDSWVYQDVLLTWSSPASSAPAGSSGSDRGLAGAALALAVVVPLVGAGVLAAAAMLAWRRHLRRRRCAQGGRRACRMPARAGAR